MRSALINYIQKHSSLFPDLHYYKVIDSTNTKGLKITNKRNAVIVAEKQTRGKGRYDRKWASTANENLYFSLLIHKPILNYNELCILTSTAVFETLHKYNTQLKIKWPNDIIYQNKKICGILNEQKFTGSRLESVVLGIGINLMTDFSKNKELNNIAVSLVQITKKQFRKADIILNILKRFEKYYLKFPTCKKKVIQKWQAAIYHKNQDIRFRLKNRIIKGKLVKINRDGSINIKLDKRIKKYNFGEII